MSEVNALKSKHFSKSFSEGELLENALSIWES
jgi:hypothetical protein